MPDEGVRTTGRLERLLALRSFPGLANVDATNLSLLADAAVERTFPKGATVLAPGRPVHAMYFIRDGELAILRDGIAVRTFTGGAIVGAMGVLSRSPLGQHVVATKTTRTFEIPEDDALEAFEESFPLLYAALRGMLRGVLAARREIPENAGFSSPVDPMPRSRPDFGLVERVLFVRKLLTYGRGRVEALAELAREMVPVTFEAGTLLWRVGDPAPHALLVYTGIVECVTDRGQKFVLGPDSVAGGIDSIAGDPRWYDATARTEIVALKSDVAHLIDVIEDNPDMGLDMVRAAARILLDLNDKRDRIRLETRG